VTGAFGQLGAIVVMGVSGSGKSTLALALSERLQCPFIEGDALHTADSIGKMRGGIALEDADRWPWLDRIGAGLRAAIRTHGTAVAACSALKYHYRERLLRVAATPLSLLWLHADQDLLQARLRNRPGHFMPSTLLASQLLTLEAPTTPENSLQLDATRPLGILVEEALRWLTRSKEQTSEVMMR
jgi:gluconokinase